MNNLPVKFLIPGTYTISADSTYVLQESGSYTIQLLPQGEIPLTVTVIAVLHDHTQADLNISQQHDHPRSISQSRVCGVIYDHARLDVSSLVTIARGAQDVQADQEAEIVLVGEHARARSRPAVEIAHYQVGCRHASAIGQLDDASREYLQYRGLDVAQAGNLLIESLIRRYGGDPACLIKLG